MMLGTRERERQFVDFVLARHDVYLERAAGKPKPWATDPILQQYRFCNVYRELDTVTQWIRANWSTRYGREWHLWFAMVIARLLNHPPTLATFDPLPFGYARFVLAVQKRIQAGEKAFGSAYIVSTNGHAMSKELYLAEYVLKPLWADRERLRPVKGESLQSFHEALTGYHGMGSFMAAQVVADVKNTQGSALENAPDWWTWAAPGPGSERGLARVYNGTHEKLLPKKQFLPLLNRLQALLTEYTEELGWKRLCAQDVQNCLCEFDKYERTRLGQGKPRQRYPGVA